MSGQMANNCPACAILKAYRDTDLFMMDIECVVCQNIISALPSNGNDETNISETASTSQAAPVASSEPKLGISIAEIRGLLEPTVTSSTSQTPPAAFQAKPESSGMTGLDHPTKPKEPKTIDPTDVPSANPPLPSNDQNATVVDTIQHNTEATNVPPVLQAGEPTENISVKTKTDKLKDCRLLWISGLEKTVKAEDLRIAFEPYGKAEKGKIAALTVNGIKEYKGIFTMKTVKDADNVIKHMNGSKIEAGNQLIQIEKRTRDPTKPKEPKTNNEVGNRSICAQQGQGTSDAISSKNGNSKEKTASQKMTDVEKIVFCSHEWCTYYREQKSSRYQGMVNQNLAAKCEKTLMRNHEVTCEQNRNKDKRFNRDASGKRGRYVPIATHGMGHKKPKTEPLD